MEHTAQGSVKYLPHAVAATAAVTLAPAVVVWALALTGLTTGFLALLAVGLVVSLVVAHGGRALWQRRPESRDLLFSDLMLWGWLRRWRMEKRLADTVALLGADTTAVHEPSDELEPQARVKALKKLVGELEAREPYTHGHSRRVARYSTMIAKKLGLSRAEVAKIRLAATLHDVGKLVVPLAILNKPDRLTDEEFAVIQRHAPVGADMVSRIDDEELTQIVAYHHERLDGSGYPAQLNGAEIPLGARIVAVADTFDALTSTRPYRPAREHGEVFRILDEEAGERLDPHAVRAFRSCYSGIRGIAAWSIVSGVPQRLLYPLGGQAPGAGGTLPAKALAALATATTAASIGIGSSLSAEGGDPGAGQALAEAVRTVGDSGPARAAQRSAPDEHGQEPSQAGPGGGGQGPGDTPGGGDPRPNPPGPDNPPGPGVPAIPGNPGSGVQEVVQRQLERVGEQLPRVRESQVVRRAVALPSTQLRERSRSLVGSIVP